ncbi:MAG: Fe-S cluster assembly protein SufD [Variibacter sp.]|nr:Fe-S cluster assembly protein SufD [Variibacter sp.]
MTAQIKHIRTQAEQGLIDAFAAHRGKFAGAAAERAEAFRMFEEAGLPHRRVEEWKYTDLRALMRDAKPLAAPPDRAAVAAAKNVGHLDVDARRLVLLNGSFVPELSDLKNLDAGLSIVPLHAALAGAAEVVSTLGKVVPTRDVAVALNTAFMTDGVVVRVAAGSTIERPIALIHLFSGEAAAVFTRSVVTVEADARLTLIELFQGPAGTDYQANSAIDLVMGDRAHVDRIKIGRDGDRALHLGTAMIRTGADAKLHDFTFVEGGAVTRNQVFLHIAGENADIAVRGANLLKGRQHVDTTMVVDHAQVGGVSRELFKHVLDDESRSVFQGKIIVRPGAQKTDGKMASHALLLSEGAEADSKPELEIFADDVQCGHGATVGALDEDLLFYLRARGIPAKEAEALLVQSFVGEAIETIENEQVRDLLMKATAEWLAKRA